MSVQNATDACPFSKIKPGYGYFGQDKGFKMLKNIFQYLLFKEGPAATIGCDGCTFLNPDKTIKDLITENVAKFGENIIIKRFSRFQLGEATIKTS